MRIPKSFQYKGNTWTIKVVPRLSHEDGTKCDGICDTEIRTIYIEAKISKEKRIAALYHELYHAVVHEAHIPDSALLTEDIEDIIAEAFAALLTQALEVRFK